MLRVLTCGLLAPCCLLAQLQLFLLAGTAERPATASLDLGIVQTGDLLETGFRIRNPGPAPLTLQKTPSVDGVGFWLVCNFQVPTTLGAGAVLDFLVRFQPTASGAHSASLVVNSQTTLLRAVAQPGATVSLEQSGARTVLTSGATVDFGSVDRRSRLQHRFLLGNQTPASLNLEVVVSGPAFHGPLGLTSPVILPPGNSVSFDVSFEPQATGPQNGTLRVNQRTFQLRGTGLEPPFAIPQIILQSSAARSGQQVKLAVRLASPSPVSGSGDMQMYFTPSVPGARNDPAVLFLASGSRFMRFTVDQGAEVALFNGQSEIEFQTGTTAGVIDFVAQWGDQTARASLTIAPEPVVIDSTRVVRALSGLEVQLTGFDNARSASQLAFTFFDQSGRAVDPGRIGLDAAAEFRHYFDSSELGGAFALRAVFPVTGDAAQISAVEVEITSSLGTTQPGRIRF
jgi:hypothetical protein